MAPNRGRNRAKDFQDLGDEPVVADFDPEADHHPDEESDSDSDVVDHDANNAAREHYESVGKSKLKKDKLATLGPQYRGSRIDRHAVAEDEDEEDDPFARGFDEESDSDGEDVSIGNEDEDEDEVGYGSDDVEHEDDENENANDTSGTEMTDDEVGDVINTEGTDSAEARAAKLRKTLGERQSVTATLQQASKNDAEKGRAVKQQRGAFDILLNTRIKLQKALVGVNSIAAIAAADLKHQLSENDAAIQAAEAAALNLWTTLTSYRDESMAAKTGAKRKREDFSIDTPTSGMLAHLREQDGLAEPQWKETLQKWSDKTRDASAPIAKKQQQNAATIIDVVKEQLSDSARLLQRTRVPRSCAPIQSARGMNEDAAIYDDADFYGLLLKELLEQKSQDSVVASNIDLNFQLRRENKTKKTVDTKASKGRKLRYTVHEKLQNFMAPEDRSTWGDRQTDELFGSLFGQRLALGDEKADPQDEDMLEDGVDEEEAGLLMFRS